VEFASITAVTSSGTSTPIVVALPARSVTRSSISEISGALCYRHGENFSVTVTPKDAAPSSSMSFVMEPYNRHGNHDSERAHATTFVKQENATGRPARLVGEPRS
jgi:hypothetical protein